jgi:hypothetical protein
MTITVDVHDSWASIPVAMSRLLIALAALEKPRQPGDDGDDLTELLDGLLDAPAPAAPAPARPSPAPQPAPPPASRAPDRPRGPAFDGVPQTGPQLYKFACQHKALPAVNRLAKTHGFRQRIVDLDPDQVAILVRELTTAQPPVNGRA